jgi:hypothetical protein
VPVVSYSLGIQNATQVLTFPCGTRSCFQDCVFWLPLAAFYQHTVKRFLAGSYLTVWLEVSFLIVPQGESVVLGGAVSKYLTVLPSGIIFQPDFRRSSAFWTKLTDLASCIGVRIATVRTR